MRYLLAAIVIISIPLQGALAQSNNNTNSNTSGASSNAGSSASSGSKTTTITNPTINNTPVTNNSPGASVTQNYNGGGSSTIHNTPDAVPGSIYGGTNPCAVGASAAMSVAGLGIGGGGMWNSPGCERRNGAVILFQANMPDVAVALLCQDPEIRTAFRDAGKPCPADRAQVASNPEPVAPTPVAYTPPPPVQAPPPAAPPPAPVVAPAPVEAPAAPPAATDDSSGHAKPSWCETTPAPRPSDHGSDATSYRYYCQ